MASKKIANKDKRPMTKQELMHQIAVMLKPNMDQWMTIGARLKTFDNSWPYDNEEGAKCTSIALAQSGFEMTNSEESAARCVCCAKEMLWDPTDDPFEEHANHSPHCYMVLEGKPASEMTILDYIRMHLWKSAFAKTNNYKEYVTHLQDAMDSARIRCHELLLDAERQIRDL